MNRIRTSLLTSIILGGTLLYGCGSEPTPTLVPPTPAATAPAPTATVAPPSPTTAPTEAPTQVPTQVPTATANTIGGGPMISGPAGELMLKSETAMKAIKSFHYTLTSSTSSAATNFKGEGDFVTPDKARIMVSGPGGAAGNIELILIGNQTYMKSPGTTSYLSIGSVGSMFAGVGGVSRPQDLTGFGRLANTADIVGDETIDGASTTHVSFTYDVSKALEQAAQAAGSDATPAPAMQGRIANGDMWIEKGTNYVRQIKIVSPPTVTGALPTTVAGGDTTVLITYSKFDEPVNPPIEKPAGVQGLPGEGQTGVTTPEPVGTPVP